MAAAFAEGHVGAPGLVSVLLLWGSCTVYQSSTSRTGRTLAAWTAVLLALALATHRIPGFSPLLLSPALRLSPASPTMVLRAQLDYGIAGLLLLAFFPRRSQTSDEFARSLIVGPAVGMATAALVLGSVALWGAVRFDPKLPALTPQWLAVNLFVTCVFEEALFRGMLQERLATLFRGRPWGASIALVLASGLFGLAHAGGGPVLVVAAMAAGVGYGIAYMLTGRIEAPVLAHFTLNSVHFLLFTYPYAPI